MVQKTRQSLGIKPYDKGLCEVGDGCWAWLQPDGGWGLSNAGLVAASGEGFLVDTLYDARLTEDMLAAMRRAVPAANNICTIANTHSNGDHCNGNACVPEAQVVASQATVEEMANESPQMMAGLLEAAPNMGELGEFFSHCFSAYDFANTLQRLPDRAFEGELRLPVGDLQVELLEVGPAHTRGDTLAWVPSAKVVFTGDILFIEDHPIMWAGPVSNWLKALDRIEELQPHTVVPGHGPVTDLKGVQAVRSYIEYTFAEAKKRHAAGMDVQEAARDINLADYDSWGCVERIVANLSAFYRELDGEKPLAPTEAFALMAKLWKDRR